jgi:hypothetical protein
MKLPERAKQIIFALWERNRDLSSGTDDQRRQLARNIAEQLRFELGDQWGWKSADPGRPPSKDAVAFREKPGDTSFYVFDLFNGSTREPWADPAGELVPQNFIDVSPGVNHLGMVPTIPSPEPVPPPVDESWKSEVAAIKHQLDQLLTNFEALVGRVRILEERPEPSIDVNTSRAWGHSHRVRIGPEPR